MISIPHFLMKNYPTIALQMANCFKILSLPRNIREIFCCVGILMMLMENMMILAIFILVMKKFFEMFSWIIVVSILVVLLALIIYYNGDSNNDKKTDPTILDLFSNAMASLGKKADEALKSAKSWIQ